MQYTLYSGLLGLLITIKPIVAWVEPLGFDVCPADVSERSTQSTSLLQGVTHKSRAHQEVAHDDDEPPEVKLQSLSRDDDLAPHAKVQFVPRVKLQTQQITSDDDLQEPPQSTSRKNHVLSEAEQPVLPQAKPLPIDPSVRALPQAQPTAPVLDDNPQANPHLQSLLPLNETLGHINASNHPLSLNGTNVERLALLVLDLKHRVHSALRGAPLQSLAGMMTVVLGIFLLTGLTLVLRWSCTGFKFDDDEAFMEPRPAPIDKFLFHSHAGKMPPNSGFVEDVAKSDAFCPALVVPEDSECVLMVPKLPATILDAIRDSGDSAFRVVDQEGDTCLCIRLQSFAVAGDGLRVATPGLRERIVLMSATQHLVLAYCERHGLSFHVHCQNDELFARLNKDEKGTYALVGRSGPLLQFNGQLVDCSVRVTDAEGRVVAYCEKGDKDHFTLRVGPLVDVGLVLCGLLALDRMEAEKLSMRSSTTSRVSTVTMASKATGRPSAIAG